jgi:preprotein translocase subunit YajC
MHPLLTAFLGQTAGESPGGFGGAMSMPLMLLLMFGVFYFVLWRPQSKERKRLSQWIAGMKKGDEVVTQSGIIGTVHQVEDRVVTLDVGGGNKLRLLKSQVVSAWKPSEPAAPAKAEARK